VLWTAVGCTSPEAPRLRAGGPGADVGNRTATVRMHEGSSPFHGTPRLIASGPSLDPAEQARRFESSRR
jgi:hypothetical protein